MLPVKLGINLGLDQFSGNSLTVDHHALVKLMTARADDYDFKTQRNKNDQFPDGTLQNIGTGRNLFHPSAPYPASRLAESI